jgi:uncharacterized protein (TIGR03382 family)
MMALALLAGLARADIAVDHEPPCEPAMCPTGAESATCNGYHETPDACRQQWEPAGYTLLCTRGGATVWTEVWCKAGANTPDPQPTKHGCMGCDSGSASIGLGIGLLGLAGALTRRR